MFGLVCDSCSNLPEVIMQQYQIRRVPLRIILSKTEYRDDNVEITEDQLLQYMQKSLPKTSLPFYEDIVQCFEDMIKEGMTEILAINMASELSGTYNSFVIVAKKMMKKYPEVKIEIMDSRTLSIGIGLLLYKAANLKLENPSLPLDEMVSKLHQIVEEKNKVLFVVPTLKFLIAGGRIGRIMGTVGEMLHIKPILGVAANGSLHQVGKVRGLSKAVDKIISLVKEFAEGKEVEGLAIYHSGKSEETLSYVRRVQEAMTSYHIPQIYKGTISSTLLVHGGPGLVGVGIQLK